MPNHSHDFLDLAIRYNALRFGEFTFKSGRVSPYFFNLGAIASGSGMARLADNYAEAAGLLIALDRQERGADARSPIQALAEDAGIRTVAVATLANVIGYTERAGIDPATLDAIHTYRMHYGVDAAQ